MQVLESIKAVNANRIDIDTAVELLALGSTLKATYEANAVPVPVELADGLTGLSRLIAEKRREAMEAALKAAKSRRASLATAEEKRKAEDAEIEKLETALGIRKQTAEPQSV